MVHEFKFGKIVKDMETAVNLHSKQSSGKLQNTLKYSLFTETLCKNYLLHIQICTVHGEYFLFVVEVGHYWRLCILLEL